MELLEALNEYWSIVVAVVVIIGAFVRMESAIKTLKRKDDEQEDKIKQVEKNFKNAIDKLENEIHEYKSILIDIRERIVKMETMITYREKQDEKKHNN